MAVPKYHYFMKPLLERLEEGRERKILELDADSVNYFQLTEADMAQYLETDYADKSIFGVNDRAISSSIEFRSKKEHIQSFIRRVNVDTHSSTMIGAPSFCSRKWG